MANIVELKDKSGIKSYPITKAQAVYDTDGNTITTKLASDEASIASLQGQVSSFTHMAEGSTTGDAELINARNTWYGSTETSAGDAIRNQTKNMVLVQQGQPTGATKNANKMWVKPSSQTIELPDMDDIAELKNNLTPWVSNNTELLSDDVDLLLDALADKSATSSGVTYTLTDGVITAVGTATGTSSFTPYGSTSSPPPEWMGAGKKYVLKVENTTPAEIRLQAKTTTQTSIYTFASFKQGGDYIVTIPDGITVFRIMLTMPSGSVANGAVKLEINNTIASADLLESIGLISDNLTSQISNSVELLSDEEDLLSLGDKSATSSGIAYTLTDGVITAVGTATGISSFIPYGSTSSPPPEWMGAGKKYAIKVLENTTPAEICLQAKTTTQTSIYTFASFRQSGNYIFTIPDGITVFRIMLTMPSGSVANGAVKLEISNTLARADLLESIESISDNYLELATDHSTMIPDNTDFDTIATPGTYKVTNNAHAATMTNIPVASAGKMIVIALSQTSRFMQIYAAAITATPIYVRFYNGSFTTWEKISYENPGYVKYTSGSYDSGKATEELDIYLPVTSGYIKYVLYHYINSATDQNYDVWRIYHVYHVVNLYDSNIKDISISGEWECALRLSGRDDFSGGSTHGDEVMYGDVVALRNGKPINLSSLTELTSFREFTLIRTSKLYDPADHTTVIADHGVQYDFAADGMTINQSVIWKVVENLANCFLCMFLPSKNMLDRAVANSDFTTIVLPSSIGETLTTITKSKATSVTMWDTTSGVSADVSIPLYPTGLPGGDQISLSDNGGNDYNKLYFKICGSGTSANGEMWKATSKYKLDFA